MSSQYRSLFTLCFAGFIGLGLSTMISIRFLPQALSQDQGDSFGDVPPPLEGELPPPGEDLPPPMEPGEGELEPLPPLPVEASPQDPNLRMRQNQTPAPPAGGTAMEPSGEELPEMSGETLPEVGDGDDKKNLLPPFDPGGYFPEIATKRDPFQPSPEVRNVRLTEKRVEVPLEPLQRYDLSELKVLGIMWDIRQPRAMVADPSGKVHIVKQEQKIGRKNGVLAMIREGELVIVESEDPGNGKIEFDTRVLAIGR